ncbi:MAG TPA: pteridine reductase [Gammaproteobacteria bacterium]|nr:pteridine reductase [Gammaproteobacteria bacterium]
MSNQHQHGKVALVTGSARRVGAQTVRSLHAAGYNVVIHYRNSAEDAGILAAELNALRDNSARTAQGDLTHVSALPRLVEEVIGFWGRLDVLVNNASAFYPTEVGEITEKDWDILVGSNLKGPMFLSQAAAPELTRRRGCIVNMVDIHADRPLRHYLVYSVAKAGLVALTKSLARELGPAVRANGVAPGAILWPEAPHDSASQREIIERTALKREGEPADIARTILFLVDDAPYITGQIIAVDGGRTLSN